MFLKFADDKILNIFDISAIYICKRIDINGTHFFTIIAHMRSGKEFELFSQYYNDNTESKYRELILNKFKDIISRLEVLDIANNKTV